MPRGSLTLLTMGDIRALLTGEYRTVAAEVGPQAGALAHIVRTGAEAALCGVPRAELGPCEDVDEPVCTSCVAWYSRLKAEAVQG